MRTTANRKKHSSEADNKALAEIDNRTAELIGQRADIVDELRLLASRRRRVFDRIRKRQAARIAA